MVDTGAPVGPGSHASHGAADASPPIGFDPSREGVWPLGGFAPGWYTGHCRSCGAEFVGDKRAGSCLTCAIIGVKTQHKATVESLNKVNASEGRLRVALWNELRRNGVPQDRAIELIREAADGPASAMSAGTVETHSGSGRQPASAVPQADANTEVDHD